MKTLTKLLATLFVVTFSFSASAQNPVSSFVFDFTYKGGYKTNALFVLNDDAIANLYVKFWNANTQHYDILFSICDAVTVNGILTYEHYFKHL
jgi:hypothetical protein